MSDQPGSGQDPHNPPTPPGGPPPGFGSGDPLGPGSSAPAPPPSGPDPGPGYPSPPHPSPPAFPAPDQGGFPPAGAPLPGSGYPGSGGGLPPGLQSSGHSVGGPQHSGQLAGWGTRVLALIVDALILTIPLIIMLVILGTLFASDDDGSSSGVFGGGLVLTILAAFLVQLAYYPLMMKRQGERNGQTIGKQVMNIRAVRTDSRQIDLSTAMMREIVGKVLPGAVCGLYTLADYLWPLWDSNNQALHDKIGSTVVVKT